METARERDRLKLARSAQVSAAIERLASTDFRLRIANAGNASARNLRVLLDGKPALDHSLILRDEDDVTSLGPGAAVRYILAVTMGSPRVFDVLITWEDDSGEPGKWESQLKI